MNKVHVIIPMAKEFAAVGRLGCENAETSVCGVGKVNAALAAADACLRARRPDLVLSVGCAGALDESLRLGDVIVSESAGYWDVWCGKGVPQGKVQGELERFPSPLRTAETVADLLTTQIGLAGGARATVGEIVTGDTFCTDKGKVAEIHRAFPGASAIDMESAAVAHVCHKCEVPVLSIRVISDTLNGERAEDYEKFWAESPERRFGWVAPLVAQLVSWPRGALK